MKKISILLISAMLLSIVNQNLYCQGNCVNSNNINNVCNEICYGSFEEAIYDGTNFTNFNQCSNDTIWRFFRTDSIYDNSIDIFKDVNGVSTFFSNQSPNPMPIIFDTCNFNLQDVGIAPNAGKNYIGMVSNEATREGVAFDTRSPLDTSLTYTFSFLSRKAVRKCRNLIVEIFGGLISPCQIPQVTKIDGSISSCGYKAYLLDSIKVDTNIWIKYSINFKPALPYKNILVSIKDSASDGVSDNRYGYFDNFKLTTQNNAKHELYVKAVLDTPKSCYPDPVHIKYIIKLHNSITKNSDSIKIRINTNFGQHFLSPPFDINGNYTIPINSISKNDSIVLHYYVGYSLIFAPISSVNVELVSTNYCINESSSPTVNYKVYWPDSTFKIKLYQVPIDVCNNKFNYFVNYPKTKSFPFNKWEVENDTVIKGSVYRLISNVKFNSDTLINFPNKTYNFYVTDTNFCRYKKSISTVVLGTNKNLGSTNMFAVQNKLKSHDSLTYIEIDGDFSINTVSNFKNIYFKVKENDYHSIYNQTIFNNCTFKSCNYLWNGLMLRDNGKLEIYRSRIENAIAGISKVAQINSTSTSLVCQNTSFINNLVGIYLGKYSVNNPNQNYTFNVLAPNSFIGNNFYNTSANLDILSLPNLNQYPAVGNYTQVLNLGIQDYTKSYCGVYLNDANFFQMGQFGKAKNTFNTLNMGVVAHKTNLNMYNFSIHSIYNVNYEGGIGIYMTNGRRTTFVNPAGKTYNIQATNSIIDTTFNNSHIYNTYDYGLLASGVALNLSNTKFSGISSFIQVESEWSLSPINIKNSYFFGGITPPDNIKVRSYYKANITSNYIETSPDYLNNSLFFHGYNLNNQDSVNISNNRFYDLNYTLSSANKPSFMLRTLGSQKKLNINNNLFKFRSMNTDWDGAIGMYNCKNTHNYSNTIIGQGASFVNSTESASWGLQSNPNAIFSSGTTSAISCNKINDFNRGIHFTGSNLNSIVSVNNMTNHTIGLQVDNLVTINPQLHQGNKWSNWQSFGAKNDNPPLIIPFQQFTVHTFNAFAGSLFWPLENTFGLWFRDDMIAPDKTTCDIPASLPPKPYLRPRGSMLRIYTGTTELERLIIQGGNIYEAYNYELIFQNRLEIYAMLKDVEDSLASNSIEKLFLNSHTNTSIGQFVELDQKLDDALSAPHAYTQWIDSLHNLKNTIMSSLAVLDSLKGADSFNLYSEEYNNTELTYLSDLALVDEMMNDEETLRIDTIYSKLDGLILFCQQIPCLTNYEEILKQVYLISLNQIKNNTLSSQEIAELNSIATLCPLVNEKAVYMAQSLLMADSFIYYSDVQNCTYPELRGAGKNLDPRKVKIYPNPATNETTIEFKDLLSGDTEIMLYDIMGRIVFKVNQELIDKRFILNLTKLHNNIYILKIYNNGTEITNQKINVLH